MHEKCQNQRKGVQSEHWTNYIYVIFPRFINNPLAWKERDCRDQEIADSKNKKKNASHGVGGCTNIIWDKKTINLPRSLTIYKPCGIYIRNKIYLETEKLVSYEFRNLDKTW